MLPTHRLTIWISGVSFTVYAGQIRRVACFQLKKWPVCVAKLALSSHTGKAGETFQSICRDSKPVNRICTDEKICSTITVNAVLGCLRFVFPHPDIQLINKAEKFQSWLDWPEPLKPLWLIYREQIEVHWEAEVSRCNVTWHAIGWHKSSLALIGQIRKSSDKEDCSC